MKCTACNNRAPERGFKRCKPCRTHIRALERARRTRRRRLGLCPCGGKREPGHKLCRACNDYFSARAAVLSEERRLDGLCPKCGRVPQPGYRRCEWHLALERGRWASLPLSKRRAIMRRRVRSSRGNEPTERVAQRVTACKARWRAAERCITCGNAAAIKRDGSRASMCRRHLNLAAARAASRRKGQAA
jgi:hypothetical protein